MLSKSEAIEAMKDVVLIVNQPGTSREVIGKLRDLSDYLELSVPGTRSAIVMAFRNLSGATTVSEKANQARRTNGLSPCAPGKSRGRKFKDPEKQAEKEAFLLAEWEASHGIVR